ncbi:hypothetical protein ACP6PK_26905 [Dapis sp. BLCC M172]
MKNKATVAYIGTGDMGRPMIFKLLKLGLVTVAHKKAKLKISQLQGIS